MIDDEAGGCGSERVIKRHDSNAVHPSALGGDQPFGIILRIDADQRLLLISGSVGVVIFAVGSGIDDAELDQTGAEVSRHVFHLRIGQPRVRLAIGRPPTETGPVVGYPSSALKNLE